MYEIQTKEHSFIQGGSDTLAVLGTAAVVAAVGTYSLASLFGGRRKPYCYEIEVPFTQETKVYDPITGEFLGTQYDDFVTTKVVCE